MSVKNGKALLFALQTYFWCSDDMKSIEKRKLKRRNRWADVLAAIILCGALALGLSALRDYMRGQLLSYTNAEEGTITLALPAELLVLRHEYVLHASATGIFTPQVEEGARIKEGTLIGYCGGEPIYAIKGGAVSYLLDGWESKLQIASLHELDWQQVFSEIKEEQKQEPGQALAVEEETQTGQRTVARVVDNLLDYTVLLKLQDPHELLTELNRITFCLTEDHTITSTFQERWQTPEGDVYYIFNKISFKEDILFSLRYSEAEIIAREVSGVIVPCSAISLDKEGRVGVFIRKKRKLVFIEIEELASKDDISVVSGLDKTAVVVTNPNRARDGQRI
jgi:hypothetical protein